MKPSSSTIFEKKKEKISFWRQNQGVLAIEFPVFGAQKLVVHTTHRRKWSKFYVHPVGMLHKSANYFSIAK